jgi:hypothetical protein
MVVNGILKRRRAATRAAVVVALAFAFLIPGPVAAGGASPIIFNARDDFRVSPNEANPSGPWSYRQTKGPGKPLLDEFFTDHFFVPGLETWHGQTVSTSIKDKLPFVGVNATGSDQQPLGIDWRAGALLVHPTDSDVVIRWTSPMAGSIRIRAAVIDRDNNCGEGVNWVIQLGNQPPIAKGNIPNGGSIKGLRTGSYRVAVGSRLELRVGKGPDHAGCDSTQVRLRIALSPDV